MPLLACAEQVVVTVCWDDAQGEAILHSYSSELQMSGRHWRAGKCDQGSQLSMSPSNAATFMGHMSIDAASLHLCHHCAPGVWGCSSIGCRSPGPCKDIHYPNSS